MASQIDGTIDVTQVFSTENAFAALRADGSVVTWGACSYGGDSSAVASQIDGTIDVIHVFSTDDAFAALRADGSVVTWGDSPMVATAAPWPARSMAPSMSSGWPTPSTTMSISLPVPVDDFAGSTVTTGTVRLNGSSSGSIESMGDTDWFKVTLTAGHAYRFDVLGADAGNGTLADPYMELRDSAGTILVVDNDSGAGFDAQIAYTPTADGTYFVSAHSFSPSGTGTYQVSVKDGGARGSRKTSITPRP